MRRSLRDAVSAPIFMTTDKMVVFKLVPQVDCGPLKSSSVDEQTQRNKIQPVPYSEFLDIQG
jgi:hypothetical protein